MEKGALIFTANETFVADSIHVPKIPGETARVAISLEMAKKMLRKLKKKDG